MAAAPGAAGQAAPTAWRPENEDEKTLYVVGQIIAARTVGFSLSPQELAAVQRGIADRVLRRSPLVDIGSYAPKASAMMQARFRAWAAAQAAQGDAYRAEAGQRAGARQLPSGVIVRTEREGSGSSPGPTDRVTVHYVGTLTDGAVFDSTRQRGQPARFPLNGVIWCWQEGLSAMKAGERATLVCPPANVELLSVGDLKPQ
jgi:FKBP-type peptidyl-prolyl cis-trans isomerase FkpA